MNEDGMIVLYTVLCNICIVWAMCDTVALCFHPNDLPSLADGTFPHDEVKLTGHKKLTFGVAKVVLVSTL